MPFPEWEEFLDKTVSQVRFRHDRREIRQELTEHLEDARDAAEERGEVDPAAAALSAMGDPVELGLAPFPLGDGTDHPFEPDPGPQHEPHPGEQRLAASFPALLGQYGGPWGDPLAHGPGPEGQLL